MPIKDLTERRRMPRLGKIRTGIKVQSTGRNGQLVEYPKAVDYFVCPPIVQAVYGEKPKSLDIVFVSDDMEVIADQWYKAYSRSRGLVCRGNGEFADRMIDSTQKQVDRETGEILGGPIASGNAKQIEWVRQIPCPGRKCPYFTGEGATKQCGILMNLQFVIDQVPGLGVWQLDTGSINGILNVNSTIDLIKSAIGTIVGVPMQLTIGEQQTTHDGKKQTNFIISLDSKATWKELMGYKGQTFAEALVPPPDESRDDLLYPDNGFSDDSVIEGEGAVVDDAPEESVPANWRDTYVELRGLDEFNMALDQIKQASNPSKEQRRALLEAAVAHGYEFWDGLFVDPKPDDQIVEGEARVVDEASEPSAGEPETPPASEASPPQPPPPQRRGNQLGKCEQHNRNWAKDAEERICHPVGRTPNVTWCYQTDQETAAAPVGNCKVCGFSLDEGNHDHEIGTRQQAPPAAAAKAEKLTYTCIEEGCFNDVPHEGGRCTQCADQRLRGMMDAADNGDSVDDLPF